MTFSIDSHLVNYAEDNTPVCAGTQATHKYL